MRQLFMLFMLLGVWPVKYTDFFPLPTQLKFQNKPTLHWKWKEKNPFIWKTVKQEKKKDIFFFLLKLHYSK